MINLTQARVLYEDTDAGGIAYFGRACRWIEQGVNEWFRIHILSLKEIAKQYNLFLVMRELSIGYKKPIVYDEVIFIQTSFKELRPASVYFKTEIVVQKDLHIISQHSMVPIDCKQRKAALFPKQLVEIFNKRHACLSLEND